MQDIGEYVAACPVCAQNKTLNSLRASYTRYPYPSVRGRTLHWTLSRDCHHPQVTLLYSRSLTGFQRQSTLWPYLSFHLPWRLLSCSPSTFSGSTASLWTSSLTRVPSSLPGCGRSSVLSWGPRLACHQDSLLKPTIRQNGLIRNWKQCCVVSSRPTHQLGVSSSRGWNMLTIVCEGSQSVTIPACWQPPEYPHLRHPWAISPRSSLSLRRNWLFPLSSSTCGAVGRHGVLPEWPS